MKIALVIPAYNEEQSIKKIVSNALKYGDVIVVNDGSADTTSTLANEAGAFVVDHIENLGYDQALKTGMHVALELKYEFAITLDADGQHDTEIIKEFILEFGNHSDLVLGYRDKTQRFAECLFAIIGNLFWGIKDPLCGMKGYNLGMLRLARNFDTYGSIGTELAIRAAKSGYKISFVPIKTAVRLGKSRFGGGLRPNLRILRAMFLAFWKAPKIKNGK